MKGSFRVKPTPGEHYAVFSRKGKFYWPQGRFQILPGQTNRWECRVREDNPGDVTDLIAKIDEGIHLWVRHYLKVGHEKSHWIGLDIENPPEGMILNDEVTVNIT